MIQKGVPRNSDDLLDNTAFLIMDIGRLLRVNYDQRMRRLGMTRSEWWLLAHLWYFEGASQQEMADLLDMTKGGLAKLIARLETLGIVERRGETRAGRATKTVFFTVEGRLLAQKVDKGARQLVREAESPLHADQVDQLHQLLRSVRKMLLSRERRLK